jgi:hypothetical protein
MPRPPGPCSAHLGLRTRAAASQPASQRSVWPSLWRYLVVTWLAAGGLKEVQPLTHIPTQVLTLTQFGPSIAVLAVLAMRRGPGRGVRLEPGWPGGRFT